LVSDLSIFVRSSAPIEAAWESLCPDYGSVNG
jgi:hypothetical protein